MVMLTTALDPTRCPVCRAPLPTDTPTCGECGEDLAALQLVDSLPILRYNEALALVRAGQIEPAIEQLQATLALAPNLVDARVVLGKLHGQQGRYEQAIACWQQVLVQTPDEPRALAGIARVQAMQQAATVATQQAAARATAEQAAAARRQRQRSLTVLAASVLTALVFGGALAWTLRGAPAPQAAAVTVVTTVVTVLVTATPGAVTAAPPTAAPAPPAATPATAPPATAAPVAAAAVPTVAAPTVSPTQLPNVAPAVRQALAGDGRTASLPVQVESVGADLRLRGTLPAERLRDLVVERIRSVEGVRLIDTSQLRVERPARIHVVRPGDTLYGLADRYYGDGRRWRLILEANSGQLTQATQLRTGMQLTIPDELELP